MKEQQEEPEVLEESLSSGASGAADKEGRMKSDVTVNFHKCSVFGSVFSNITNVSPDAQKEDKDEDNMDKTSSKTVDEEVNRQRRHKTIQFTERRPVVVIMYLILNLLGPPSKYRTLMRTGGLKMWSKEGKRPCCLLL